MGSVGSETTRAQRVRAIRAERRWIMTGTPAPAVRASDGGGLGGARGKMSRAMATATHDVAAAPHRAAAALHPLLDLLRAAPFGSSRALWHDAVLRPLRERRSEGIATLRRTLSRLLVRASKAELGLLPPLTRRAVRVSFAPSHARAFNQLADLVRLNLLLADWNDPEHQESLLHRHRAQYARELYVNVRKACCVAGAIRVAPQEHDLCETLTLLARRRGLPTPRRVGLYPQNGRGHRPRRARRRRGRRRFARERRVLRVRRERNKRYDEYQRRRRFVFRGDGSRTRRRTRATHGGRTRTPRGRAPSRRSGFRRFAAVASGDAPPVSRRDGAPRGRRVRVVQPRVICGSRAAVRMRRGVSFVRRVEPGAVRGVRDALRHAVHGPSRSRVS